MNVQSPALELGGVSKRFGDTVAVDDVSIRVERGAFLGLLGRNGAGKTTSINLATGLYRPTTGRIIVLGLDIEREPIAVRRRVGVMPQDDALLEYLAGPRFLQFVGAMHGLDGATVERRSAELFETLELDPPRGALVRDYSYGMKKKLALGAALLHGPELLFLDEPFEGIDPVTAVTIRSILSGLASKGVTIVMSSHVLEIVEKICGTIAILDKGRLLANGSLESLRERHGDFANLEELFLGLMGGAKAGELSWL